MNNKLFISVIATLLTFGSVWFALAAPAWTYERTLLPESDNAFDLGTTTQRWRNTYAVTASSTNLIVSGLSAANCDVKASSNGTFSCGTDSTGATDPVATSTNETAGRLSYWTTTSGTPARLGDVATTTLTGNNGLTLSAGAGTLVGGSNATLGLATINAGVLGAVTNGTVPTSQATSTLYGADGIPNSALANSTISGISLGGTLGALTATDGTLTFSGSYTGATARTVGLNVGNANTWTAAQLFNYTATTSFSGGLYGSLVSAPYFHATSTTATSTFSGNVRVVGNLQVDGNFFAPVTLVNSGDVRIDGTLNVVGAVDLDTYTSAILLTGAGGDVAEYAGTSCTNQAITTLSALGAATCSSINNDWWSGTDLSVANGGTGVSTFTSSQLLYGNGTAALSSVATTSLSIGLGLSHSATLGALVGGSAGTLTIATSSLYTGTTGQFPYFSGTGTLTATSSLFLAASGNIGIGSTTPANLFSVGAFGSHFAVNSSGTIMSAASQPATSTAITLNWATTPNSVEYRLGGAATTITVINATTSTMWGSRKLIQLWNPNGAAGAITFVGIEFSSAYTQTTAANRGDFISCVVSMATSTTAYKVFCTAGAASQ